MPQITDIQTPNPEGIPVSVPNIVTSLNTDMGPMASPSAFGPDLSGLAQGMSAIASSSADITEKQTQAKNATWALQQRLEMGKTYSDMLSQGPTDPNQFADTYQKDLNQRVAQAPTPGAAIELQRYGADEGLQYYKHNLYLQASANIKRNDQTVRDTMSGVVNQVLNGTLDSDSASKTLNSITAATTPAAPGAPSLNQAGQAAITQAQITNLAKTHGPDVAAAAVRSGLGSQNIDPVSGEILATNLDNQAQNDIDAQKQIAQKGVNNLQKQVSNGQPVTPQETLAAATNLQRANDAAPINSNPPSLTDFVTQSRTKLEQVESGLSSKADLAKVNVFREIGNSQLALLTQQRMLGMPPDQMKAQVQDMADAFGTNDPVVQRAAMYAEKSAVALTPGTPAFDPAGLALQLPDVRASMKTATQTMSQASLMPDGPDKSALLGKGQQLMQQAMEKNFAAQRRMGVQEGDLQPLTADYARTLGGAMDKPEDIKANLSAIQSTYGEYAPQVITQAFKTRDKGTTPGAVQLALLNPSNDGVWAAATFKDKLDPQNDKPTIDSLKSALKNNSTFNNYFLGQQQNPGAAQDRVDWGSGLIQMAHYYMNQTNASASQAMNMAVANTIGSGFQTAKTDNGNQLVIPTSVAQTPQQVSDIQDKANIALKTLQAQSAGMVPSASVPSIKDDGTPAGQKLDAGTLWNQALTNGYWVYQPQSQTIARYQNGPKGAAPLYLSDGRPLAFDVNGLKSSVPVDKSFAITPDGRRMDYQPSQTLTPADGTHGVPQGSIFSSYRTLNTGLDDLIPAAPAPPPSPVVLSAPGAKDSPRNAAHPTKVTQYGYPGDPTPDSNTRRGIGMADNPLTANAVALAPATEARLGANPGDVIQVRDKNGTIHHGYFADRTSQALQDDRVDFYRPDGMDSAIADSGDVVNLGGGKPGLKGDALAILGERNVRNAKGG